MARETAKQRRDRLLAEQVTNRLKGFKGHANSTYIPDEWRYYDPVVTAKGTFKFGYTVLPLMDEGAEHKGKYGAEVKHMGGKGRIYFRSFKRRKDAKLKAWQLREKMAGEEREKRDRQVQRREETVKKREERLNSTEYKLEQAEKKLKLATTKQKRATTIMKRWMRKVNQLRRKLNSENERKAAAQSQTGENG